MVNLRRTSSAKKSEHELEELLAPRKRSGIFGKKSLRSRSEDSEILSNKVGGGIFRSASKDKKEQPPILYEPPMTPPLTPENSESSPVGNVVGVKNKPSFGHPTQDDDDDASGINTTYSDITDNRTYDASPMLVRHAKPVLEETLNSPDPPGDVVRSLSDSDPVTAMKQTLRNGPTTPPCCGEDTTVDTTVETTAGNTNFVTKMFDAVSCSSAPSSVAPISDEGDLLAAADVVADSMAIRKVLSFTPTWGVAPSVDEEDGFQNNTVQGSSQRGTNSYNGTYDTRQTDLSGTLLTSAQLSSAPGMAGESRQTRSVSASSYTQQQSVGTRSLQSNRSNKSNTSNKSARSEGSGNGFEMVLEDHKLEKTEQQAVKDKGRVWKRLFKKHKEQENKTAEKKSKSIASPTASKKKKKMAFVTPPPMVRVPTTVRVEIADEEEEKKEDDASRLQEEQAARGIAALKMRRPPPPSKKAGKEARYRNILSSFKGSPIRDSLLETVLEIEESSQKSNPVNENTELKVRVPGIEQPDLFLTDEDLVGSELVEEDESLLDDDSVEDTESTAAALLGVTPEKTPMVVTPVASPAPPVLKRAGDAAQQRWLKEVSQIPKVKAEPVTAAALAVLATQKAVVASEAATPMRNNTASANPIQKSRSWYERFGIKRTASEDERLSSSNPLTRNRSAPGVDVLKKPFMSSSSVSSKKSKKKNKPIWKATVDDSSGRTYYYHRLTRTTTWTKPEDFGKTEADLAPPEEPTDAATADGSDGLRNQSSRDFNPTVRSAKEQIASLLQTMAPPDGTSVERLMKQYEGNEEELLVNLKDLAESRPFDEPIRNVSKATDDELSQDASPSRMPTIETKRTRTGTSFLSGFSGTTKVSEQTRQIRNTANPSQANVVSSTGSFGSNSEEGNYMTSSRGLRSPARVPSKIPVPRARELQVEEFTSDRVNAETYGSGVSRSPRRRREREEEEQQPSFLSVWDLSPYLGDAEDTDVDTNAETETDSLPTAISNLSETDTETDNRQAALVASRRRALDDAIATKDWDLAATLSERLRDGNGRQENHPTRQPVEWTQSELDKFISENDWDAVANYIAHVRDQSHKTRDSPRNEPTTSAPPKVSASKTKVPRVNNSKTDVSNPKKRFGARSQLQHGDINSDSSWDSSGASSYYSEDSSDDSYYSDDDPLFVAANSKRRTQKEFAC